MFRPALLLRSRWIRRGGLACVVALVLLRVVPHASLAARFSSSVAVRARSGELLRLTLAPDGQYRLWTPLREIAPPLADATCLYEDRQFRVHPGVNPAALARAAVSTFRGRRRMGGSTVTMQLARRLWDLDSRTLGGKLRQIAGALWLEARYAKAEILEAYLNTVPYGGNVEGVGAAALVYFGKDASALSLAEALTLAVIPQNPSQRGTPLVRGAGEPPALVVARTALAQRYEAQRGGHVDWAARAPLRTPAQLPFHAPHLVDSVLSSGSVRGDVRTTLDLRLQRLLERQVQRHLQGAARLGIRNAAVMLVDTRDLGVRGLVGSADFFDDSIAGQVNGTAARRSPGSTLKPFVYALGLEQGVIHPLTVLRDVPITFSAYAPENFDGRYVGPVTARDALIRSRNVPALAVAAKLSSPSLYEFLSRAGVLLPMPEAHYGLGLTLGAGEVTMEELAALYAALGNRGVLRPLRALDSEPQTEGTRVLSEEAAWLVVDMLRGNPRPDRPTGATAVEGRLRPAWKTGTSWGFRDAWTVGLVGPYVLAVWIGNFSGEGHPSFIGVSAAAPLFFAIVDALQAQERSVTDPVWAPPAGLGRVSLCAVTGQLPGPHCPHQQTGWFIPGRSPIETCQVHREILVDARTGHRVCGTPTGPVRREVHEIWPTDTLKLFADAGLPRRPVPPAGPDCAQDQAQATGLPPRITSPRAGMTYSLRAARLAHETIALEAETDGDAREVFWYVDRSFAGKSRSGTPLFWAPHPGRFIVRAVDERGRSDARPLNVEVVP